MKIQATTLDAYNLLHEGCLALSQVEANGIRIDEKYLQQAIIDTKAKIRVISDELTSDKIYKVWKKRFGLKMNMDSGDQLGKILFGEMGYKCPSLTSSGKPKTDISVLESMDIDFVKKLLQIKKLKKAVGTYLKGIQKETCNGFLHPVFNLHLVETFRSSSDSPNFQNQPVRNPEMAKLIRTCFIPRENGHIIEADFCFPGNTLIETIDGPIDIKTITENFDKKDYYVFCYKNDEKRIGLSKVIGGRKTKENTELIEVVLDDGQIIKTTPNHRFMLRDGSYEEAQNLKENQSLMPLYFKKHKTHNSHVVYKKVYLNNGQTMLVHNLIALDIYKTQIKGSCLVVHHKNSNGCDNSLDNLEIMDRKQHMRIHSKQGWRKVGAGGKRFEWNRKYGSEFTKKLNEKRKEEWTEEQWQEFGKRVSEGKARAGSPKGEKNGMFGKHHSEESKLKNRLSHLGITKEKNPKLACPWKGQTKDNCEFLARISKKLKGRTKENNESIRKMAEKLKGRKLTEEHKQNIGRGGKGKVVSEKTKELMSKGKKKYWEQKPFSICQICLKQMRTITNTHLKYAHNITIEEYKKTYNHKVKCVRICKEREDVYNITVEKDHNYALACGVIVKNCGVEVHAAEWYHRDPIMLEYISNKTKDMHRDMAQQCYMLSDKEMRPLQGDKIDAKRIKNIRYCGKNKFVFPQFYGDWFMNCAPSLWAAIDQMKLQTRDGLSLKEHLKKKGITQLGVIDPKSRPSPGTFVNHIKEVEFDFWNNRFAKYKEWKDKWWEKYQRTGQFTTLTGFVISGLYKRNEVINYPVQGVAFHCLLWSLIQLQKQLKKYKMKSLIVGQIHDSIVADVCKDEVKDYLTMVKQIMTEDIKKHWTWINTPLEVEAEMSPLNRSWYEKAKVEM